MGAVNIYFPEKDTESSKHANRCSTSLTIREIKLKTQLTFTTHQLECLKLKQTNISDTNSGKYEEKWDAPSISRSNNKKAPSLYKAMHKNSKHPITLWLSNWSFQFILEKYTPDVLKHMIEKETMACIYRWNTIQQEKKRTIDKHSNMTNVQWIMPKKAISQCYTLCDPMYITPFEMTTHIPT